MVLVILDKKILARVPQGSELGPLLLLIYINDVPHDISSICERFADYTSLFSKERNCNLFFIVLNYDLETINQWAYQWKKSFNPDSNKQATEVLFSGKVNSDDYPQLTFNHNPVHQLSSQKHVGLF